MKTFTKAVNLSLILAALLMTAACGPDSKARIAEENRIYFAMEDQLKVLRSLGIKLKDRDGPKSGKHHSHAGHSHSHGHGHGPKIKWKKASWTKFVSTNAGRTQEVKDALTAYLNLAAEYKGKHFDNPRVLAKIKAVEDADKVVRALP